MLGETYIILFTTLAAAVAAVSQYLLKNSIHKFKLSISGVLSLLRNRGVVVGVALYIGSAVFYLSALDSGALSFVYSIFSSTFIFVLLLSYFLLKEKLSAGRLAGTALIIIGIIIIALTYG
jgi:drug/metabolite transporter (DMT)-like permease